MDDALATLDEPSRQTVVSLLAVIRKIDGKGVGELFERDGQFTGALSAGSFRGSNIIEAHFIQVFKRLPKGPVSVDQVAVTERQVVIEWCITNPEDAAFVPIPARYTLLLGPSGLIHSLRAEWNPKFLSNPPRP